MITRRGFLHAGLFGAGAAAGGLRAPLLRHGTAARTLPLVPPRALDATLALSLSSYQEEVRTLFHAGSELPEPIRYLYGLNCIQGILLETEGQVVLAGRHDPALPEMELDDLLVALRNAFKVSAEYQEPIGCTIDPIPGARDPWEIQSVKVLGMPFGAPMGDRHVEIDYELKRVGAGLKNLGPTVTSLYEMTRAESIPCQGGETPVAQHSSTHRFWFTPLYPNRKPRFLQDGGAIWIEEPIHVQVQSEEEFLDNGKRVGGAPPQPAAVKFAESINKLLAGNEVRPYAHLRNDFRLVEVAAVMQFKQASAASLEYLLRDCPLRRLDTPSKVGGIRRQENGEAVCDGRVAVVRHGGSVRETLNRSVDRYRSEYRGGVEAAVSISGSDFNIAPNKAVAGFRQRVWASRASGDLSHWQIRSWV